MIVEAAIDVEIDGQPARLEGEGKQLELLLGRQETLSSLLRSNQAAPHLAGALAELGLTLTIIADNRPLLKLGQGVSSRVSGVVTGSRHVAPANLPALLTLIRVYLAGRNRA